MSVLSVRQARVLIAVAEQGSVTGAAQQLNKTQTSVSKSLREIEVSLGAELFERSSRGVTLSVFGDAYLPMAKACEMEFRLAKRFIPPVVVNEAPGAARFFRMDVSDKWLDALVAIVETRNVAAAAQQLGVTNAAVSASLRKLEDSFETRLFERSSIGVETTHLSRELVRHVKLGRNYLRQGIEAIARVKGVVSGRVVVGTLPFVRTKILPSAIIAVLEDHPELDIVTVESPYDDLVKGLRCGDVDFVMGALRGDTADADIYEEAIVDDDLSIVVRKGHPLAKREQIGWSDLFDYAWVLPREGTPTRSLVQQLMVEHGFSEPSHVVESSSFVTLRGLVMDSNFVTILSRHQIIREEQVGMLAVINLALPGTSRPIGIMTRANSTASPAVLALIEKVRSVIASL